MPRNQRTKKTGQLKPKLVHEPSRVWDALGARERAKALRYSEGYIDFLNACRTERLCVTDFVRRASDRKFVELAGTGKRAIGFFQVMRQKLFAAAIPGKKPLSEGIRLITSHLDCPRLDLKPNPLYEDTDLALLKTHYYGGVKKYHWVARSLAVVGTVILGDGRTVDLEIGLKPGDPVFTIPDLLPHYARKQMEKKASEFIPAENLNVIFGSFPCEDKESEQRIKLGVLQLLHAKFGITEEDFTSAEIEIVPAEPARDAGLDKSLVAGYGQDNRVCAYTSFTALIDTVRPDYTAVAVFFDKEEIGSEGNTGAQSRFLDTFLMDLMERTGTPPTARNLNRVYMNGKAISADVHCALDPTYLDVFDKRNAARLGYGVIIEKYSGHGGKYTASDANAEYAAWIRNLFNSKEIAWQAGGWGKVDEGGGGTVAKYLARAGIEIIDVGPPLLGMHSPLEVTAKEDVWMCKKAFDAFFNS